VTETKREIVTGIGPVAVRCPRISAMRSEPKSALREPQLCVATISHMSN
jgi:hypothetical protein